VRSLSRCCGSLSNLECFTPSRESEWGDEQTGGFLARDELKKVKA